MISQQHEHQTFYKKKPKETNVLFNNTSTLETSLLAVLPVKQLAKDIPIYYGYVIPIPEWPDAM